MQIKIYSRKAIERLLSVGFPKHTAVISFYDPVMLKMDANYKPIDYSKQVDDIFQIGLQDISLEELPDYDFNYESYFPEVDELSKFVYNAYHKGMDIICQCDYGQGRSAGCAAAILEHFYHTGIWLFWDERYIPNQMIFDKLLDALAELKIRGGEAD